VVYLTPEVDAQERGRTMGSLLKSPRFCFGGAMLLVAAIGVADHFTPIWLSWSMVYLLPIVWASWRAGWWPGIVVGFSSIGAWLLGDLANASAVFYWHAMSWDLLMRAGVYVFIACVLSALREARDRERALARTDALTEVANGRAFIEAANLELERAKRHQRPITLAYIDLDDFKMVNDRYGHKQGDAVLRDVAGTIRRNVRAADTVARIGGDEFVILFPETGQQAAGEVLARIRQVVDAAVRKDGKAVTLSVGAVTFSSLPASVDSMLRRADDLLYDVKRSGKNAVAQAVFSAASESQPGEDAVGVADENR